MGEDPHEGRHEDEQRRERDERRGGLSPAPAQEARALFRRSILS
jgi:hypothetical protein